MSNQASDQLHARIGSERKQWLSDHADERGDDLKDVAADAVDLYKKEVNGERIEPANISKLSAYDIGAVALFIGAIMSGVLTLAGEALLPYTVAFALTGMMFWAVGQYNTPTGWSGGDRA